MVIYEEYKKAITAPRAETSTYLEATQKIVGESAFDMNRGQLTITSGREGRLNVSSQRTITSGPTVGDGDKDCTGLPGPADILSCKGTEVLQRPNDIESKGICAQPRDLGEKFKSLER